MSSAAFFLSVLLVSIVVVEGFDFDAGGVFGKLKSGLKLAGKLFGLDTAGEVAKLVTDTFGNHQKGDPGEGGNNIFSSFFRLLGLESNKIGAIAINTIVFLAQLISTTLSRPPPAELSQARLRSGTPFDWILSNSKIADMIAIAKDPKLPDYLIDYIKERTTDEESGCVQLLICKISPFLKGMQKSLNNITPGDHAPGPAGMLKGLPTMEEFQDNADLCEEHFPTCII